MRPFVLICRTDYRDHQNKPGEREERQLRKGGTGNAEIRALEGDVRFGGKMKRGSNN